jgi:hypothetical protein
MPSSDEPGPLTAPTAQFTPSAAAFSRAERAVFALLGATSGIAGGAAVVIDGTNTGGVPLLIGLGAFFGYVAISGQRITRLKVGDNEANFGLIANRMASEVLEDPRVSADAKGEVAEVLDGFRADLPPRARRAVDVTRDEQRAAENYRFAALEAAKAAVQVVLLGRDNHSVSENSDRGLVSVWPGRGTPFVTAARRGGGTTDMLAVVDALPTISRGGTVPKYLL